jgi:hypothetical protein
LGFSYGYVLAAAPVAVGWLVGAAAATDAFVMNPVAATVPVIVTAAIKRGNVRTDVLPAQQDGLSPST